MPTSGEAVVLSSSSADLRSRRARYRQDDETVALVPTMGSLHEGHLALVDLAREAADRVVMSIFVNPTQFGPTEDFAEYPRDLDRDLKLAGQRGVDLIFAPSDNDMYPVAQTVWVEPGPLAERLCGRHRPGHFRGVLTIVAKLFAIVEPDVAVFGRKDYQQAALIRQMARELCFPVDVQVGPTVREPDGLALSSRNQYLLGPERRTAASLPEALRRVRTLYRAGTRDVTRMIEEASTVMKGAGAEIQYVEIVRPESLEPVQSAGDDAVCLIAAYVGETRLIDNAPLGGSSTLDAAEAG
jgi:pantoate--beta-alanine ligase